MKAPVARAVPAWHDAGVRCSRPWTVRLSPGHPMPRICSHSSTKKQTAPQKSTVVVILAPDMSGLKTSGLLHSNWNLSVLKARRRHIRQASRKTPCQVTTVLSWMWESEEAGLLQG